MRLDYMESVFCFEIAVDFLRLRKKVKCGLPYIAVAFLDFPTILIHLNANNPSKCNEYAFQKGKSCLFKISPTELYQRLKSTEIYLIVLDKDADKSCVGSSSFNLSTTIKEIIGDLQTNGIHKTSCHGASGTLCVTNFMHVVVGHVDISYKLTSLGHSILPHLNAVAVAEKENHVSYTESYKNVDATPLDNVICPPPLLYVAESEKNDVKSEEKEAKTVKPTSKSKPTVSSVKKKSENDDKNIAEEGKPNKFMSVCTTADQTNETTQTDVKSLDQYPILQGLIEEVMQLGLQRPSSAPEPRKQQISKALIEEALGKHKPRPSTAKTPKQKQEALNATMVLKQSKGKQQTPAKKPLKYPLQYGLTNTVRLRMAVNAHPEATITLSKKPKMKKHKPIKKKTTPQKSYPTMEDTYVGTKTKPVKIPRHEFPSEPSYNDEFGSEHLSTDDLRQTSTDDVITVRDTGSPRALSRQSIEIRVPTAQSSYADKSPDKLSEEHSYKYSDDFDDDQLSPERSTSAYTNLETSPQNTAVEYSTDFTGHDTAAPQLSLDLSPQPTASELSISPTIGGTYIKTGQKDASTESISSPTSYRPAESSESLNFLSPKQQNIESSESLNFLSPKQQNVESSESIDFLSPKLDNIEEKQTDTSSSVATTMMASRIPVPPPSDSPVIRSLASESTSNYKNPRPPSMSHSSSYERIRRRLKKSTESSFNMSDLSDLRTSELGDIHTSDISTLHSSEDISGRMNTQRYISPSSKNK